MNEQIKINWYRCKVDKALMSELMRRSDTRAFTQVLLQLALFAATGALAFKIHRHLDGNNWPWMLPLLLGVLFLHGTNGSFFGGCACHELSHKTPFATQGWNTFFLRLYAFLSWFDPVAYRASHIRHHQATTHRDHDGEVVLPQTLDWQSVRFFLGAVAIDPLALFRLFRFWIAVADGNLGHDGFFRAQWLQRVVPETDQKTRQEMIDWARTLLCGHLALAAVFILSGHWFLVVVVNLGCLYSSWLTTLTGLPQHFGLASDTPDFRLCCRTYTCGPLPAFFYWNMQYHVEHHMFPAVPFYNLPRLRRAIAHDLPPATHGLWATWTQDILPVLRRQQADPNFVHVPPLPRNEGEQASDLQLLGEAAQTI
ncbi:MAG: fatty acid desaturase [Opitutae bacterium]|nr:fatty acid desaturase [Opitutae bacterium]